MSYRDKPLRPGLIASAIVSLALFAGVARASAETATVGAVLPLDETGMIAATPTEAGGFVTVGAASPSSGAVAPFDGTVKTMRIEGSAAGATYSISTLRREPNGSFTITGVSPSASSAALEFIDVETFAFNLPVKAGEYVALDFGAGSRIAAEASPSLAFAFSGSPAIGTGVAGEPAETPFTFGYNVDIEKAPPAVTPPVETPTAPPAPAVTPPATPIAAPAPPAPGCVVPKLVGKRPAQARKALRAADCKAGQVTHVHGADPKAAKVVKQSPKPGTVRAANSPVALKVG